MKKNQFLLHRIHLLTIVSFFISSCYTYDPDPYMVDEYRQKKNMYYVASALNTPLLSEKNDLNINAISTVGPRFSGYEMHAAYLPLKHAGITGSLSHAGSSDIKYNKLELGVGYITRFSRGWHFENYAGAGSGRISNKHHTGSSTLNLTHFFIQPALAISNEKKTFQLGFASRFSGVNIKVTDISFNSDRERFSADQINALYDQPFHVMWQPGIVLRVGWKSFLYHGGFSWVSDLTQPHVYMTKENFSFGLSMRLNTNHKKPAER